ncbi:MAG: DUF4375 domain-containing protein [Burkholderiales bacterium]|nr:MAG: DUF4375 domain-containing protein [Burkholderiales bacterium]
MLDPSIASAYDHAVLRLDMVGGHLDRLEQPLRTLLVVESAQGIIESGGLAYFYEADFPNNPPYETFVEAYRLIGASEAASCIEASAALFPFAEPHLFAPLRELWLEKMAADPGHVFHSLSARIGNDDSVWQRLTEYVHRNPSAFAPA